MLVILNEVLSIAEEGKIVIGAFYASVTKTARKAMKEDMKAAMRTFVCLD